MYQVSIYVNLILKIKHNLTEQFSETSFDYVCESNIENLKHNLTEQFSETSFDYNSQANFCNFTEIIHSTQ